MNNKIQINKKCQSCSNHVEQVFCNFDYNCEHERIERGSLSNTPDIYCGSINNKSLNKSKKNYKVLKNSLVENNPLNQAISFF